MAPLMDPDLGTDLRSKHVAVVMQRRSVDSPWQSHVWEPAGVLAGYEG